MLTNETFKDETTGSTYPNFTLHRADGFEFLGRIFPPLSDEQYWPLDDPGDTNALEYQLEDGSFTIKFRLRQSLRNSTDYVVVVWGFRDENRIGSHSEDADRPDPLGYARIRAN